MRALVIDGRCNKAGGGRTVFEAVAKHLVPALRSLQIEATILGPQERSARLPLITGRPALVLNETGLCVTKGSPKVVLVQNLKCWGPTATIRDRLRGSVARWNVRSATHVVAALPSTLLEVSPYTSARMSVVPFGVDPIFRPGEVAARSLIVAVGTVVPHKRYELLLAAFAQVEPAVRKRLHVVGSMPDARYSNQLRQLSVKLEIGDEVEFVGLLDRAQLVAKYQQAVCVVQASSLESFGFPLLEGAACGALVVATDQPSVRDIVPDLGGLVVPDGARGLSEAIRAACQNPGGARKTPKVWGWPSFSLQLARLLDHELTLWQANC